ncbi:helix-turn-helix domain-containing protein [Streptomyces sp. NBS 14/10]|uniref:helix-turn-helix domain-containing protein n=1 Tax=Streptomyces sp. NBS 14/10 TaxID=1945643 RepID=UPI000B7FC97E|nr:helix-turn-helix domain-containing protein [Streptomyces sp. NBS 14/10]KAK1183596.1 helix-turn-helix domain-containing protein [Streptomyces sp. NBS 14/10]
MRSRQPTATAFSTSTSDPGRPGYRAELELGPVRLSVLRLPAPSSLLARSGDPRAWRLVLVSDGPLTLRRRSGAIRLEPGQLVLWDPWEPFDAAAADRARPPRAMVLHLPGSALSLPHHALRGLVARPVPSDAGPAALLARFLEGLAGPAAAVDIPQATWVGRAAVDLAVAFLSSVTDVLDDATRLPRQVALLGEIKTYIDRNLSDPDLSPTTIAAAHHISVRYLHHLFRQDEQTVGGFVRERRLERCRADLTNPCLAGQSMSAIRARWGFQDAAVFNRAFKKEYGITPGEYRRREGVRVAVR